VVGFRGRQGGGAIVNISTYSVVQPFPVASVSEVLRNALAAWTKAYADTHGPMGIRMNNVLPGWFENTAGRLGDHFVPEIPLRRLGLMHELGATIAFLASEGGAYITGQNLRIDGGLARPI
jgi:NAD(P)-dependent dehydrogenase (short-subunit alcohol dehydrogenase family)